jgi:hypothetical protein
MLNFVLTSNVIWVGEGDSILLHRIKKERELREGSLRLNDLDNMLYTAHKIQFTNLSVRMLFTNAPVATICKK